MAALLNTVIAGMQERVNLTKLFRRNACMKHGVPWPEGDDAEVTAIASATTAPAISIPDKIQVEIKQPDRPALETKIQDVVPEIKAVVPEIKEAVQSSSLWKKALPWIVATGLAGTGGGGAAWLTNWLTQSKQVERVIEKTTSTGSLYQYLEDHGYHLPEKKP